MTPVQCKMARAALGWGIRDLGERSKVAPNTVTRFEGGGGVQARTIEAMQRALEAGGVEFIPQNGGGPGVRLKKSA